jgi:small-conductance mechanosensitive channel
MSFLKELRELDFTLFNLGGTAFTVGTLLQLLVLLFVLLVVARRLADRVVRRALARTSLDAATQMAIGKVVRYSVLIIGLLVVLQTAGINLTAFHVVAGALGVGVGFGLQNIFSNFISGLIITFERPIKIGDRIELAGVDGTVMEIGARRTTVVTRDNIAIIVPNQRFIVENVVNLLYVDRQIRVHVPVSVAAGTDPARVRDIMLAAAQAHAEVLRTPPPAVEFVNLGGAAMAFDLVVWTTRVDHRRELISDLNYAVCDGLRSHDIRTA